MYRKQIEDYIEAHREDFFSDLGRLVSIESVGSEPEDNMPFGKGPADALAEALRIAERLGLYTENWENYLGIVQLKPGEERELDILAHLDVVPAGDGWTKTAPFVMKDEDGYVYGRGTADDKGPALAALYALAAIKDAGISLKKNVRLVLGCNEEHGSSELEYYFSKTDHAPMSFSPDAEFPVINTEKGNFFGFIHGDASDRKYPGVKRAAGGEANNAVAAKCEARLCGLSAECVETAAQRICEETGISFEVSESNGDVLVTAQGTAAHGSMPEKGNNANTAMLALLASLPLAESSLHEKLKTLHRLFPHGDYYGSAAGIAAEDTISGKLTLSLNTLGVDEGAVSAVFDGRTPVSITDKESLMVLPAQLEAGNLTCEAEFFPAHHVSEDSKLVQTLLHTYETYTGEKGCCLATGGGTYVHSSPGGVAFGCSMPGVDNRMHGPDEFADKEVLLMSSKMFASAICDLCEISQ